MERTDQSRTCTDAPQVTPPLRAIDFAGHTPHPYTWPADGEADARVEAALGAYGDRAFGQGPGGGSAA